MHRLSVSDRPAPLPTRRHVLCLAACAGATLMTPSVAHADGGFSLPVISDVKEQISELKETIKSLAKPFMQADYEQVLALLEQDAMTRINELHSLLDQGIVKLAEGITSYGTDIKAARILLDDAVTVIEDHACPMVKNLIERGAGPLFSRAESDASAAQFDIAVVEEIASFWDAASPVLHGCVEKIGKLGGRLHIQQLADIFEEKKDKLANYLDAADLLLPLLPGMLGAQGPASYLVVAQSNAELAATGGFPGAMGLATADAGLVSMGGFGSVWDVLGRQAEPLPITDEEAALYGEAIGFAPDAMGHDPDFPRAAELWALSCAQTNGVSPAGVAALDPVFLQEMLGLAGASVPMPDGTSLDGSGAARALLSDVYWRYLGDTDAQDAYFAAAAAGAAEAVMAGLPSADPAALAGALASAVRSRRLNLWLADGRGQEALRALGADNGVAGDPAEPELGVYISDEVWAKISWYLGARVELGPGREGPDGRRRVPVELALSNGITEEEALAAGGDAYIVGYNEEAKRRDGDSSYTVTLYAPAGGDLEGFSAGPTPSGWAPEARRATHLGRQVLQFSAKMLPGEELVASFEAVLPEGCGAELGLDMTPLAQGAQVVRA